MERFEIESTLGKGSFGTVLLAKNKKSGETVSLFWISFSSSYCLFAFISFLFNYLLFLFNEGGHQENEADIRKLGRVHDNERSEGLLKIMRYFHIVYDIKKKKKPKKKQVSPKIIPQKRDQTERSDQRRLASLLCIRADGLQSLPTHQPQERNKPFFYWGYQSHWVMYI